MLKSISFISGFVLLYMRALPFLNQVLKVSKAIQKTDPIFFTTLHNQYWT